MASAVVMKAAMRERLTVVDSSAMAKQDKEPAGVTPAGFFARRVPVFAPGTAPTVHGTGTRRHIGGMKGRARRVWRAPSDARIVRHQLKP